MVERVPDLASVRDDWVRLAERSGNIFGTWEWADAWWRHLGNGQLALAVARRGDGEPVAILPLCVVRQRPLRLARFVGADPADELGPVCAPADRAVAASALKRHAAQTLGKSGLFLAERLWGDDRVAAQMGLIPLRTTASPVLPVSGRSFEEFLASRSRQFRNQVRRLERKVAREHRLAYRLTQNVSEFESDMSVLMRLHEARWRQGRSAALSGQRAAFHLDFAKRALERGWLRLWTMELDDAPVAAWYGLRFGGTDFYYQAGRDPAFANLNVGFVLLCHTIRCAFEDGMREYRLGRGDESYKLRFAERDPGLETVPITAGAGGRMALALMRAALRMPSGLRRPAWRLGSGRQKD